jgi:hypothetical protein
MTDAVRGYGRLVETLPGIEWSLTNYLSFQREFCTILPSSITPASVVKIKRSPLDQTFVTLKAALAKVTESSSRPSVASKTATSL